MAETKRAAQQRPQRIIHVPAVEDAFSTWIPPTIGAVLLCSAMLLDAIGALAEPIAALLAVVALLMVFCSSAAGHPGLRQVCGSIIVGGIGGVPTAGMAAWLARRSPWTRASTTRRAA